MKCLSHLDMMRTFYRAIRRSGIPICYTSGFNPHAQMVFGLPLQVGVISEAEYLDIKVEDDRVSFICPGDIVGKLNASLPEGLAIAAARERITDENIMSSITHASYEMRVGSMADQMADQYDNKCDICSMLERAVGEFLKPGPRIVAKEKSTRNTRNDFRAGKGAGSAGQIDLAPLVRSLEVHGDLLIMTVAAGSKNNVKPDLILKALNDILRLADKSNGGGTDGEGIVLVKISLRRKALFIERRGILFTPVDSEICGTAAL